MTKKTVSLDGLSVSDLTALQAQIDEQIKARLEQAKRDMKNQVLAVLAESGFTLSDIFPSARLAKSVAKSAAKSDSAPSRQKVRVKYSDGQNQWTGRGKMPLWIKSFVQSGGKLASLEVAR